MSVAVPVPVFTHVQCQWQCQCRWQCLMSLKDNVNVQYQCQMSLVDNVNGSATVSIQCQCGCQCPMAVSLGHGQCQCQRQWQCQCGCVVPELMSMPMSVTDNVNVSTCGSAPVPMSVMDYVSGSAIVNVQFKCGCQSRCHSQTMAMPVPRPMSTCIAWYNSMEIRRRGYKELRTKAISGAAERCSEPRGRRLTNFRCCYFTF